MSRHNNISLPLHKIKRAIVIGASSGIGAALVGELAQQGYTVAALARREEQLTAVCQAIPNAIPYTHDVTDFDAIPTLFDKIVQELGGLDTIIYVAGVQPDVALDEYDSQKDRTMIEVNLMGAIAWLNLAATRFERAGQGRIAGISSIAGDRGRVGSPVYNTSKAALNTYLEALRNRLSKKGVSVTTIKPGFVDTVLLENAPKTFWVVSPQEAAAEMVEAIEKKRQIVYVPARWAMVGMVVRHIPSFIFRRLSF